MKQSKQTQLLKYLQTHRRGITGIEALQKFGLYRLSSAIFKFRQKGYNIVTDMVQSDDPDEAPYARYYIGAEK